MFKSAKQLSQVKIYNSILLSYHQDGFVHEINVFSELFAILGLPEIFEVFSLILDFDNTKFPISLRYDTAFNLDDLNVTLLIF